VYVYLGSSSGLVTTPATTIVSPFPGNSNFGGMVTMGDLNGDGYTDFSGTSGGYVVSTCSIAVFLGSSSGIPATPASTIRDSADGAWNGFGKTASGDVNGDGYADMIVGVNGYNTDTGRVYVYRGTATGLSSTPATTLDGPYGTHSNWGIRVASMWDVLAPGHGDVQVRSPFALYGQGWLRGLRTQRRL